MTVSLDEMAIMCVACHRNGTFTYWSDALGMVIENARTVPQAVLDVQPPDVRNKAMRSMTAHGVVPS